MSSDPETRSSLLIRLVKPDDQAAWSEFVQIYEPVIMRMAMRRGLQVSDAQDLCQEVLTRVSAAIDQWKPNGEQGSFRRWLATITRNLAVDHFRRLIRQPSALTDSALGRLNAPVEQELFEQEEERQLFYWAGQQARQHFADTTWQAFWLTTVENQPIPKVAETLGISIGAVYIARSRVLAKIKELVQNSEGSSIIHRPRNDECAKAEN